MGFLLCFCTDSRYDLEFVIFCSMNLRRRYRDLRLMFSAVWGNRSHRSISFWLEQHMKMMSVFSSVFSFSLALVSLG